MDSRSSIKYKEAYLKTEIMIRIKVAAVLLNKKCYNVKTKVGFHMIDGVS